MSLTPDVVVVGGGPIGLWTAVQIKASSEKQVLVAEKYTDYKRTDIHLKISAASLKGLPNLKSLDPLKKLTKEWGDKTVPIKTLEEELVKCAHALGIQILKGHIIDPKTLHQDYPTAKVFIGADGAKSSVRKEIFQDEHKFNTPLQYIVQVQYKIKQENHEKKIKNNAFDTSIQSVKKAKEKYLQQKFAGHLITEIIKPLENKESLVTLRIFVDESLYKEMAGATFSNPYYFESDLVSIPKKLKKILIKWWGCKKNHTIISSALKTNKLTVIQLASYASKKAYVVSKNANGRPIVTALVGDSLQGFPFFRSFNNGFLNGTKLAEVVDHSFQLLAKSNNNPEEANKAFKNSFKAYSRYTSLRGTIERIKAFVKNLFIRIVNQWIKLSGLVPWQTVKWSKNKRKKYMARGKEVWNKLTISTS